MANQISVEEIREGLILAEPIINNYGQIMVAAGTILKEKHKSMLNTWNIRTVTVKEDDMEEDAEISNDIQILALERLRTRLKWNPRNEYEKELVKMGLINTAKNIIKNNRRNK